MKPAMHVSLSPTLSRKRAREQTSRFANFTPLRQMNGGGSMCFHPQNYRLIRAVMRYAVIMCKIRLCSVQSSKPRAMLI